jgi:gas vesicle structural protein
MANGRSANSSETLERTSRMTPRAEQYQVGRVRDYEIGTGRPPVYMPVTPVRRSPSSAGLYDVVELILDRGLVIDAFVRVSLVGIELLTIDARVVIAGVDTYLRFAEAANRLDLRGNSDAMGLPQLFGADSKSRIGRVAADAAEGGEEEMRSAGRAVKRGFRRAKEMVGAGDEQDEDEEQQSRRGSNWR